MEKIVKERHLHFCCSEMTSSWENKFIRITVGIGIRNNRGMTRLVLNYFMETALTRNYIFYCPYCGSKLKYQE